MNISITQLTAGIGAVLVGIGLWGILTRRDILRMIISFSIADTGVHLIMVGLGYVSGGTAPIFDREVTASQPEVMMVDPVPSALVLTAIVIGRAVTALMLSYAVRLYQHHGTLDVDRMKELKW